MDNKNWVKHYDTGVPVEVSLDEYQSLAEYLEINFKEFAERPAFCQFRLSIKLCANRTKIS